MRLNFMAHWNFTIAIEASSKDKMEFVDLSEAMDIPADDIPHMADFDAIIDDLPARNRPISGCVPDGAW